jgi:succinate dehydrogenase / fumarate reductase, flavoprotein subunit
VDSGQVEDAAREALAAFEGRGDADADGPYKVQQDLQEMMQRLVGIVRNEPEMAEALTGLEQLWKRARRVRVPGNREYNPGWHTALDLPNLLTVSEAVTRAALERRESRGAHFREDCPDKDPESAKFNLVITRGGDGSMQVRREPIPPLPAELQQVIEEMK